ncbi:MAG: PQQ-binding-like beta-propeller repeat protein [Terrimicrobiaceae bacterium]
MKSTPSLVWLAVSASCFLHSFATAVEWPQWRGANRDGISTEKISPANWEKDGPKQLWKKQVGTGASSVAVRGGRLYTMGNNGDMDVVFCLDAATGAEIWKHTYPQIRAVDDELDPSRFEGGPGGTPTVDADKVYTLSHEGDLFCLAAASGKVLWSKNLQKDFSGRRRRYGYAGSPLVDGNLVIVDSGGVGASTVALDKTTGALKWKAGDDEAGYSSPVGFDLAGLRCVAVFKADALVGLNAANGQELWRFPWETSYDINAPTPIVFGDKIFITSGYGAGCALLQVRPGKATEIWRNKNLRSQLASPVLVQGNIYGIDGNVGGGELRCLDVGTGVIKWKRNVGGGTLIAAGGHLLILSERGELVVAEASPTNYREAARAQVLGGQCWVTPAVANGKIYCKNNQGTLVCLDGR